MWHLFDLFKVYFHCYLLIRFKLISMPVDDFNSNGELEEVKLPERKSLWPRNSDLQMNEDCNKCGVSGSCSSYLKSSLSLVDATFDQDSNINATEVHENKHIPKAEIKLEGENALKAETRSESGPIPRASVTEKPVVADHPRSDFIPEFSADGQNVGDLFQSFKIPGDRKCTTQDGCSVASEGPLLTEHVMSASQKESHSPEDVLVDKVKENKSQSEGLGRNSAESGGGMSCTRKYRRRSMCSSDGQSLHWEKNGNYKPSYSVGSSEELSLEKAKLYKELSDSIEQTFQRTNSETKVRRSTRLQKDQENEGLVWVSLPFPSSSCSSQRTRRRTVCTLDSRESESVPPRRGAASSRPKRRGPPASPGPERPEGFAAGPSRAPERRRSFCTSALADSENTRSDRYRGTSLSQRGESSKMTPRELKIPGATAITDTSYRAFGKREGSPR